MSDHFSDRVQPLLDRLRRQPPDRTAEAELIELCYTRLRKLAGKILRYSFGRLEGHKQLDSLMSDVYIRLASAFRADAVPANDAEFMRFAAFKIRQVLLDVARQLDKQMPQIVPPDDSGPNPFNPPNPGDSLDPAQLAMWTEFHRRVDDLPTPLREVFVEKFYLGLRSAEVGRSLAVSERSVRRYYQEAWEKILDAIPGFSPASLN